MQPRLTRQTHISFECNYSSSWRQVRANPVCSLISTDKSPRPGFSVWLRYRPMRMRHEWVSNEIAADQTNMYWLSIRIQFKWRACSRLWGCLVPIAMQVLANVAGVSLALDTSNADLTNVQGFVCNYSLLWIACPRLRAAQSDCFAGVGERSIRNASFVLSSDRAHGLHPGGRH